eukprot:gnl/TRDRNA2_/TRDRNA2_190373_c0_seq1.p1 gnl/TRDRNA2_/TRDRNA2_190373_c0~~gnl/TRDRNA2_/TRDRNA2_190373_c0_seq1.p1  ORF type:complete len:200 (+),score=31.29 gnl/TRDRNA2_/TRDRNA2_190373_c0_seq1:55-600(+)
MMRAVAVILAFAFVGEAVPDADPAAIVEFLEDVDVPEPTSDGQLGLIARAFTGASDHMGFDDAVLGKGLMGADPPTYCTFEEITSSPERRLNRLPRRMRPGRELRGKKAIIQAAKERYRARLSNRTNAKIKRKIIASKKNIYRFVTEKDQPRYGHQPMVKRKKSRRAKWDRCYNRYVRLER